MSHVLLGTRHVGHVAVVLLELDLLQMWVTNV